MSDVVIRRVARDDGPSIKAVRLRALADDPSSFASTLEREQAYSDDEWAEWASGDSSGESATTLLAWRDEEPAGMIAAYRNEADEGLFHIVALWVVPEARGRGVGRFLLETLEAWIADCGGMTAELTVAESSLPARRLVESAGYRADGAAKLSDDSTSLKYVGMRKRVAPGLRGRLETDADEMTSE